MIAFARPEPDDCNFDNATCSMEPCPMCCGLPGPADIKIIFSSAVEGGCEACEEAKRSAEFLERMGML